jgi:uncharacterized protein (TIGR02284 family)
MAQRTERVVLNELIETCKDGEFGFANAADHVKEPELQGLFRKLSAERARFAVDLLPHAQRLGGDAAHDGTNAGAIHRRWMGVRSALSGHDDAAIVNETIRGDRVTISAFKDALEGVLLPQTRELVEKQFDQIRQDHEQLTQHVPHHV